MVRLDSARRAYAALLEREIGRVAALIGRRAPVSHVHWGGGTPTALPGDCLTAIMARIRDALRRAPEAEIAIELDPTSLPPDRHEALADMGVTRVSLGVQDLEPAVQEAIGRRQSYEQTEDCAAKARALGVGSLNLDLIYGLPLQTEESVARTARRALALNADRVAVFGYAHVPWMKKHQQLIAGRHAARAAGALRPAACDPSRADGRRRLHPGRPRPLRAPRRRDGGSGDDAPAASLVPGLHRRRRAGADRLRRQRDRLAAAGLCAERADRARLRQGDRGGRAGDRARRRARPPTTGCGAT